MRAAVVAPDGRVVERREQPTPREARCPDALLDLAADLIEGTAAREAVVGVPGRVNYAEGRLEYAPNLPRSWGPELSEARLREALGLPVALANDADLAAVAEASFGAARGYEDVVYVTISTGVGAGVVVGGRLVGGRRSGAEIGHTVIDQAAEERGAPATVEELGSGTALGRLAGEAGLGDDGAELTERVRRGDPDAEEVWRRALRAAGIAVSNLVHLFAPQVVVVGGGVGLNGDLALDPIRTAVDRLGPRALSEEIRVVVAELGDDAGLVGAAGWQEATGPAERTHAEGVGR